MEKRRSDVRQYLEYSGYVNILAHEFPGHKLDTTRRRRRSDKKRGNREGRKGKENKEGEEEETRKE